MCRCKSWLHCPPVHDTVCIEACKSSIRKALAQCHTAVIAAALYAHRRCESRFLTWSNWSNYYGSRRCNPTPKTDRRVAIGTVKWTGGRQPSRRRCASGETNSTVTEALLCARDVCLELRWSSTTPHQVIIVCINCVNVPRGARACR